MTAAQALSMGVVNMWHRWWVSSAVAKPQKLKRRYLEAAEPTVIADGANAICAHAPNSGLGDSTGSQNSTDLLEQNSSLKTQHDNRKIHWEVEPRGKAASQGPRWKCSDLAGHIASQKTYLVKKSVNGWQYWGSICLISRGQRMFWWGCARLEVEVKSATRYLAKSCRLCKACYIRV